MTDKQSNPTPWEKGQLRREATDWFIRMRSPEADQHKAEFERWLNLGGVHRAAYNRVARVFADGKSVNWETLPAPRRIRATVRRVTFVAIGSLMIATIPLWRIFSPLMMTNEPRVGQPVAHEDLAPAVQLVTRMGEIRRLRLSDGSWLTLDTDTLVTMHYDETERELRLEHGRARFEVAHERRPFVVDAGEGSVVAHGTIFDVEITNDQSVHVALLRGAIDVESRRPGQARHPTVLAHLSPGQRVAYPQQIPSDQRPLGVSEEAAPIWPTGNVDFADATLGDVVEAANRYSSTKLRLSDPKLATIAISGSFRVNDPSFLARALCRLLGLKMQVSRSEIVLNPSS